MSSPPPLFTKSLSMHEVVCFSEMIVVIVPLSLENILEIRREYGVLSLDGINPTTKKINRYKKCESAPFDRNRFESGLLTCIHSR